MSSAVTWKAQRTFTHGTEGHIIGTNIFGTSARSKSYSGHSASILTNEVASDARDQPKKRSNEGRDH
jgi:hypothetical protein